MQPSFTGRLGGTISLFLALLAVVAPAPAQTPPALVSVVPANGATGVSPSAAIVFTFDQAMNVDLPVIPTLPGILVGSFEIQPADVAMFIAGTWGADGRTLRLEPLQPLAANLTLTWRLNPPGTMFPLQSAAGGVLATVSGGYQIGAGGGGGGGDCENTEIPEGWGYFGLRKDGHFLQTSPTSIEPAPGFEDPPFSFSAVVTGPAAGPAVTAGSLTRPGGASEPLVMAGGFAVLFEDFETEAELHAAFPAGAYTLRFTQAGQPQRVINLTMPGGALLRPRIANHAAAQAVNAAADFTLQWDAFPGATANDRIFLDISDLTGNSVFEAPDVCVPRDLPVNATSIVIPAGTLAAGQTYTGTLTFDRVFYFSTNAVAGMVGSGSVSGNTEFTIRTGGGPGPGGPATFRNYRLTPGGNPAFELTGTAGGTYGIQRAGTVNAASWPEIATITLDPGGAAAFEDTQPGKVFPLYYRAVAK